MFLLWETSRFGTVSPSLRPLTHVQLLFTWKPFPKASVLKVSFEYLLLPPKICTGGGSRRAHARHLQARHRDPPTHCGVNLHEGALP
ncbi:hypothetical protein JTE90_007354 [Oedothorax gibbosus]|uniref:Uncharacterized protein n=1 Tax=Oedothorax gibbosus TaxID=931172 RepID=A0AAV6TF76_9ARAC|nr:hypothetical protein JTE90_007354 [Oedothorax gibbosus]